MTESTEQNAFRSRDAQEDALTYHLGGLQAANNFRLLARAMIQEAEDRGAAEEQAKAAEGQAPVSWQARDMRGGTGAWQQCSANAHEEYKKHSTVETRALFDRPANIAALEVDATRYRIVRQRFLEDARNQGEILTADQFDTKVDGDVAARAALTREGGV